MNNYMQGIFRETVWTLNTSAGSNCPDQPIIIFLWTLPWWLLALLSQVWLCFHGQLCCDPALSSWIILLWKQNLPLRCPHFLSLTYELHLSSDLCTRSFSELFYQYGCIQLYTLLILICWLHYPTWLQTCFITKDFFWWSLGVWMNLWIYCVLVGIKGLCPLLVRT